MARAIKNASVYLPLHYNEGEGQRAPTRCATGMLRKRDAIRVATAGDHREGRSGERCKIALELVCSEQ
jgi:hypothetical protein